jgi:class 3 adenylate cyclase
MGDGVVIYFGYPRAHEDDPERAVNAGLALIDGVGRLGASEPLKVRVGIATGLVVVGDLIGSGEAQERGVVGDTPNLAARLQALADPNTVVIAENTRRLTGGLFEYRIMGAVELKGFGSPIQVFQVLGAKSIESHFEARHEFGMTPFVGREEETELLLRRWRQATEGNGRVVTLIGEPGIGKSRIVRAVLDRL